MRCSGTNHFPMQLLKFTILTTAILLYTGCKKDDSKAASQEEDCTIQRAVRDGQIIDGQYIVAYKPIDAFTSSQRSTQISRDVLSRNQVNASAMKLSFAGDQPGFVATLTTAEVQRLRQDPAIEAIEPDRIVA